MTTDTRYTVTVLQDGHQRTPIVHGWSQRDVNLFVSLLSQQFRDVATARVEVRVEAEQ